MSQFTDPRDGQKYRTIRIGDQLWMAENLRYVIPGSYCYKERDRFNQPRVAKTVVALSPAVSGQKSQKCCKKYGRLYHWEVAITASPPGWHVPSVEEWSKLIDFLGGWEKAGKRLKRGGSSGFNALMGGGWGYPVTILDELTLDYRKVIVCNSPKANTTFWSSTRYARYKQRDDMTKLVEEFYQVSTYGLNAATNEITHKQRAKDYYYYSVRCIRD